MDKENMLPHKHLMVNAITDDLSNKLNPVNLKNHILKLASLINARIIIEPQIKYCDSHGNTGYIGIAGIGTSHITCHHWDKTNPQRLQLDIYSCTEYDVDLALDEILEFWAIQKINYMVIRRSELLNFSIEEAKTKTIEQ